MFKEIQKYVVYLCLLLLCLCANAIKEYPFPSDANTASNDPGGGTGGGQLSLSARKVASDNSIGLESNSGITGLSVHTQYIIIAIVCSVVAFTGIVIAVTCWCRLQHRSKGELSSASGNYSGYGVTGPTTNSMYFHESGDRKLAQSAQMYHYQHQKQQMIDMEKANGDTKTDATDEESEADNEEDFTVYEIPGLAQGGNMEVHNPLFKGQTEDTNGDSKSHERGKDK